MAIVVVGAAVVVVKAVLVVGAVVVPAEYAPPAGGPAAALSASHDDPRHDAPHTTGAVVAEIIPKTPRVELRADATYTKPERAVLTTMSFGAAENTPEPASVRTVQPFVPALRLDTAAAATPSDHEFNE